MAATSLPLTRLLIPCARRALLCLEVCRAQQYPFGDSQEPQRADWELYIAEVAKNIMDEQSPKQLYLVSLPRG